MGNDQATNFGLIECLSVGIRQTEAFNYKHR